MKCIQALAALRDESPDDDFKYDLESAISKLLLKADILVGMPDLTHDAFPDWVKTLVDSPEDRDREGDRRRSEGESSIDDAGSSSQERNSQEGDSEGALAQQGGDGDDKADEGLYPDSYWGSR